MQPEENKVDPKDVIAIATIVMFALNRTVQLFSRVPGTAGAWFFSVFYFGGLGIQLYYCQANMVTQQRSDALPLSWFAFVCVAWHLVHSLVRYYRCGRCGVTLHSYEPGLGVLCLLYPGWQLWVIGLISDLFVSACLAIGFYVLNSPVMASWYLAMIPWLLFAQLFVHVRYRFERQTLHDAQLEAKLWTSRMKRN